MAAQTETPKFDITERDDRAWRERVLIALGLTALVAVLAIVIAIVAWSSSGSEGTTVVRQMSSAGSATGQTKAISPGAGMAGMGSGASGSTVASGNVIPVSLGDFYVKMPTTLKAGTYTFRAHNVGMVEHMLMVERAPVVMEKPGMPSEKEGVAMADTGSFAMGRTKSFTVTLKPGKYVFFCNVEGHYAAGQHIDVTVTS